MSNQMSWWCILRAKKLWTFALRLTSTTQWIKARNPTLSTTLITLTTLRVLGSMLLWKSKLTQPLLLGARRLWSLIRNNKPLFQRSKKLFHFLNFQDLRLNKLRSQTLVTHFLIIFILKRWEPNHKKEVNGRNFLITTETCKRSSS
jgi:hypothetical protein